jgi:hypothetical protein
VLGGASASLVLAPVCLAFAWARVNRASRQARNIGTVFTTLVCGTGVLSLLGLLGLTDGVPQGELLGLVVFCLGFGVASAIGLIGHAFDKWEPTKAAFAIYDVPPGVRPVVAARIVAWRSPLWALPLMPVGILTAAVILCLGVPEMVGDGEPIGGLAIASVGVMIAFAGVAFVFGRRTVVIDAESCQIELTWRFWFRRRLLPVADVVRVRVVAVGVGVNITHQVWVDTTNDEEIPVVGGLQSGEHAMDVAVAISEALGGRRRAG